MQICSEKLTKQFSAINPYVLFRMMNQQNNNPINLNNNLQKASSLIALEKPWGGECCLKDLFR